MAFSIKSLLSGGQGASVPGYGVFKSNRAQNMVGGYPQTLRKADFWANGTTDISVSAASWVRIGQESIPAQQRYYLGYGVSGGNPEELGHLHVDIVDDTATNSAVEAGEVRLGYTNNGETLTCVVFQDVSALLSDTSTTVGISRASELVLPMTTPESKGFPGVLAGEDSKLIMDFKSDAADILAYTGIGTGAINKWLIPITVFR